MLIFFIIDWFTYHNIQQYTSLNPNSILWGNLSGKYYIYDYSINYNIFYFAKGSWYSLSIYTIVIVAYVFAKLLILFLLLQVFLKTMTDIELTNGFNCLFKPFRYMKINTKSFSLILTLTLRFIPNLYNEVKRIRLAQKSKGSNNSFKSKFRGYMNIVIPLFALAFESAEITSDAMLIKGYNLKNQKFYFYKYKFKYFDYLFLFFSLGISILIFYMVGAHIFFAPFGIANSIVLNGVQTN